MRVEVQTERADARVKGLENGVHVLERWVGHTQRDVSASGFNTGCPRIKTDGAGA